MKLAIDLLWPRARFGNFKDARPVDAPLVRKKQKIGVRIGDKELLHEIFFAGRHPRNAFTPRRWDD